MEWAIEVSHLTVSYHQKPALRGVTLNIPQGKVTAIMGPNGAGKSTLFKAIVGLEKAEVGEIRILGKPPWKARQKIAYLPQREQIDWDFPMVVEDIVMMGRYPFLGAFRPISQRDRKKVEEALDKVGMLPYRHRHIRHLSGGQQQRVFIARALVQEAEILFMDEPFVGIDATTQKTLLQLLKELKTEGKTIVIINHDFQLLEHFDYLIFLNRHVVAAGPPKEVYTEKNYQLTYGGYIALVEEAETKLWRKKRQ